MREKIRIGFGIIVLLVFLYRIFYQVIVVEYYNLKKDYIAKNLCVNRMNPNSSCHGKCYLKKLLKKAETPEEQTQNDPATPVRTSSAKDFTILLPAILSLDNLIKNKNKQDIPYLCHYHFLYAFEPFVPPRRYAEIHIAG